MRRPQSVSIQMYVLTWGDHRVYLYKCMSWHEETTECIYTNVCLDMRRPQSVSIQMYVLTWGDHRVYLYKCMSWRLIFVITIFLKSRAAFDLVFQCCQFIYSSTLAWFWILVLGYQCSGTLYFVAKYFKIATLKGKITTNNFSWELLCNTTT